MLDTDGDPSPLVRLWYEAGVDCMQPWEVNAVDMLKFAEEYPQYVMMGGIYKHMFEPGHPGHVGRFQTNRTPMKNSPLWSQNFVFKIRIC